MGVELRAATNPITPLDGVALHANERRSTLAVFRPPRMHPIVRAWHGWSPSKVDILRLSYSVESTVPCHRGSLDLAQRFRLDDSKARGFGNLRGVCSLRLSPGGMAFGSPGVFRRRGCLGPSAEAKLVADSRLVLYATLAGQDDRLWILRSRSEQSTRRRRGRTHSYSLSLVPCTAREVTRSAREVSRSAVRRFPVVVARRGRCWGCAWWRRCW